jgi:hypothetical protein
MKYVILLFSLLSLASCVTQKKVERFLDNHQEVLAKECAENFAPKDSIIVKDSVHFDTLYQEGLVIVDTFRIGADTIYRNTQCPKTQIITKVIRHDSVIYQRDRAAEYVLQDRINKLNDYTAELNATNERLRGDNDELKGEVKEARHQRNKWRVYFFTLLAVAVGWQFRKGIAAFVVTTAKGIFTGI